MDLIEHCVAQVNCESPGCRWATEYRDLSYTPGLGAFTQAVIRDIIGLVAEGEWRPRVLHILRLTNARVMNDLAGCLIAIQAAAEEGL